MGALFARHPSLAVILFQAPAIIASPQLRLDNHLVQMVALELYANFNCFPVFLGAELKERYYKGERLWCAPGLSASTRSALNVMQCTHSQAACAMCCTCCTLHMLLPGPSPFVQAQPWSIASKVLCSNVHALLASC